MKTTIGDIADFYNKYPEYIGKISVETRHGFKQIQYADITAYSSEIIQLETVSGKQIEGSPEHLLFSDDNWKSVNDLNVGQPLLVKDGDSFIYEKIVSKKLLPFVEDLYDLQVEGHEFLANDIVSHNSQITDALCFGLYGKAFRNINKNNLINSINQRDCVVEIVFETNNKKYRIIRGIKPNIFEIYCDDVLLNQDSSSKDYQEYLEKAVIKLNYKSFTQIVILGSASFTPFMQLPAAERRSIIEELLDIQIFSVMNDLVKNRISSNKDSIQKLSNEIELNKQKYQIHKKHSDESKIDIEHETQVIQKNIHDTELEKERLLNENRTLILDETNLKDSLKGRSKFQKTNKELETLKLKIESNSRIYNKEISLLENNQVCPTCHQNIADDFKERKIAELKDKLSESDSALSKISEKIEETEHNLEKYANIDVSLKNLHIQITSNDVQIKGHKKYINECLERIEHIKSTSKQSRNQSDVEIKNIEERLEQCEIELNEMYQKKRYYETASIMLKDTGIKTRIIQQYLPIINRMINKFLSSLDFFVDFTFDETFKETIKSRYRDEFTYHNFSEGEKTKINIALLFTWRSLAKLRSSYATNLLIMDEIVDSALDFSGIDNFLNLLNEIESTSVFIISPKGMNYIEKFENVIKFDKPDGFSRIV